MADCVCPATKSFLISLAASAKLELDGAALVGHGAANGVKACAVVDAADDATVAVRNGAFVSGYYCRSACFSAANGAKYEVDQFRIAGVVVLDDGAAAVFNLQNSRAVAHTFRQLSLQGSTCACAADVFKRSHLRLVQAPSQLPPVRSALMQQTASCAACMQLWAQST